MPADAPRSFAASVVGWLIVAIVVYLFSGWIIGTLFWLGRLLLVIGVLAGLAWLYVKLKGDP
jgi:hypothetical protein